MIINVTNVPESLKIPNLTIINSIKDEKVNINEETEKHASMVPAQVTKTDR